MNVFPNINFSYLADVVVIIILFTLVIYTAKNCYFTIVVMYKHEGKQYVDARVMMESLNIAHDNGVKLCMLKTMKDSATISAVTEDKCFTTRLIHAECDCEPIYPEDFYVCTGTEDEPAYITMKCSSNTQGNDIELPESTFLSNNYEHRLASICDRQIELNTPKLGLKLLGNLVLFRIVEFMSSIMCFTLAVVMLLADIQIRTYTVYCLITSILVFVSSRLAYGILLPLFIPPILGNAIDAVAQRNGIGYKTAGDVYDVDIIEEEVKSTSNMGQKLTIFKYAGWKSLVWMAPAEGIRRKTWAEHPGIGTQYCQAIDNIEDAYEYMKSSTTAMAALVGSYILGSMLAIGIGATAKQAIEKNPGAIIGAVLTLTTVILTLVLTALLQLGNSLVQAKRVRNIMLVINKSFTFAREESVWNYMIQHNESKFERLHHFKECLTLWTSLQDSSKAKKATSIVIQKQFIVGKSYEIMHVDFKMHATHRMPYRAMTADTEVKNPDGNRVLRTYSSIKEEPSPPR